MEQELNTNANAPFLLIQKPQELIRLFESLIDKKIREILPENLSLQKIPTDNNHPFLNAKEVAKIFNVSRQTINDWRKSELLQSFKIKSRRFFFKEQVELLKSQMNGKSSSENNQWFVAEFSYLQF